MEEILTLMKEMHRGQREKTRSKQEGRGEAHNMVVEVSHLREPERMLQEYSEAATEELSRKGNESCDERKGNMKIETKGNKKKSEEIQEDVGNIKKKKNDDLREHTEKEDGRKKRRAMKHAEKRSRSKEARIEKVKRKRRMMKAESVSLESISDTDL